MEITSEEQNKVKRIKRTENSLRDLWDNTKCANIRIIGVPEEAEQKKPEEKIFDYSWEFPQHGKEIVVTVTERDKQVYEADTTGQLSDDRHKHIVDEWADDFTEGTADDHRSEEHTSELQSR